MAGQRGLSLFELMIALTVVGVLSAIALPAYRSYVDTAAMTRVAANFEQGVRVAQAEFAKVKSRLALGINTSVPNSTAGWVDLLNKNGVLAPGGGPAFVASNNNKDNRGDAETGAIGVQWRMGTQELRLWRPLYLSLVEQRADITAEGFTITVQRKQ